MCLFACVTSLKLFFFFFSCLFRQSNPIQNAVVNAAMGFGGFFLLKSCPRGFDNLGRSSALRPADVR